MLTVKDSQYLIKFDLYVDIYVDFVFVIILHRNTMLIES